MVLNYPFVYSIFSRCAKGIVIKNFNVQLFSGDSIALSECLRNNVGGCHSSWCVLLNDGNIVKNFANPLQFLKKCAIMM